ncbi:uncharacterized protein LOC62_02G001771 [Vanrija pseudolonga]|uniref:Uncharacterized protein n=1 Tax=Vanrija pseudolonga TaxID=143232 RepID=A0AAF0Y1F6_9TREE|nr:hypothetical protein LOC62_02G001771 [Vanrija pseudolonga]
MATISADSTQAIATAVEGAHSAYLDDTLDNLAYKHKTLYALFSLLQAEGTPLVGSNAQLTGELGHTLLVIKEAINSLPRRLTADFNERQTLSDVKKLSGRRSRALGVVAIVTDSAQPFASWAVPFVQSVLDGNAVLFIATPGSALVLGQVPDHYNNNAAYPVIWNENPASVVGKLPVANTISGPQVWVSALVCPSDALPRAVELPVSSRTRPFAIAPLPTGSVPIIVDQSVLPNGTALTPAQEAAGTVPSKVVATAKAIARALEQTGRGGLGAPRFLLVHENIAKPLLRALQQALPADIKTEEQPLLENMSKIQAFLSTRPAQSRSTSQFLPIYTVRSLDGAIDFVQNSIPTPSTAYVFAAKRFAAYAFNFLKELPAVYLNTFLGG